MFIDIVFNRNTRYSAFPVRSATFVFLPLYLNSHSFLLIVQYSRNSQINSRLRKVNESSPVLFDAVFLWTSEVTRVTNLL